MIVCAEIGGRSNSDFDRESAGWQEV